jgi:hypothetical protein|tara:strand:+ start:83 stop:448 length:366 start_codon:yes stop_codon:yes gene_type:complete
MDTSKVRAKYCHWDGYVENNGKILEDNYQEARKVAQLVELGDQSSLAAELADCVFYGRDKGETDVDAQTFDDVAEFVEYYKDSNCEFFYLLTRNGWIVSDGTMSNGTPVFTMLETELLEKV